MVPTVPAAGFRAAHPGRGSQPQIRWLDADPHRLGCRRRFHGACAHRDLCRWRGRCHLRRPGQSCDRRPPRRRARASGCQQRRRSSNAFSAAYTLPGTDKLLSMIVVAIDQLGVSSVSGVSSVHFDRDERQSAAGRHHQPRRDGAGIGRHRRTRWKSAASDPDAVAADRRGSRFCRTGLDPRRRFGQAGVLRQRRARPPCSTCRSATSSFTFSPPASGTYVLHSVATDGSGLSSRQRPGGRDGSLRPDAVVTVMAAGDGTAVEERRREREDLLRASAPATRALPLTVCLQGQRERR